MRCDDTGEWLFGDPHFVNWKESVKHPSSEPDPDAANAIDDRLENPMDSGLDTSASQIEEGGSFKFNLEESLAQDKPLPLEKDPVKTDPVLWIQGQILKPTDLKNR